MARDLAPAPFVRDRLYGTRLSHATRPTARDPATDTTARDDPFLPDDVWLSGDVR